MPDSVFSFDTMEELKPVAPAPKKEEGAAVFDMDTMEEVASPAPVQSDLPVDAIPINIDTKADTGFQMGVPISQQMDEAAERYKPGKWESEEERLNSKGMIGRGIERLGANIGLEMGSAVSSVGRSKQAAAEEMQAYDTKLEDVGKRYGYDKYSKQDILDYMDRGGDWKMVIPERDHKLFGEYIDRRMKEGTLQEHDTELEEDLRSTGKSFQAVGNQMILEEMDTLGDLYMRDANAAKDKLVKRAWTRSDLSDAMAQGITALRMAGEYDLADEWIKKKDEVEAVLESPEGQGKIKGFAESLIGLLPFMGKRAALGAIPFAGPAASFKASFAQGAGDAYAEMRKAGVEPKLASELSDLAGIPYAAIEKLQIDEVLKLPGAGPKIKQAFLKKLADIAKKRGVPALKESLEETLQEAFVGAAEEIGKEMSEGKGVEEATWKERLLGKEDKDGKRDGGLLGRLGTTFGTSLLTFGALEGIKGGAGGVATKTRQAADKILEKPTVEEKRDEQAEWLAGEEDTEVTDEVTEQVEKPVVEDDAEGIAEVPVEEAEAEQVSPETEKGVVVEEQVEGVEAVEPTPVEPEVGQAEETAEITEEQEEPAPAVVGEAQKKAAEVQEEGGELAPEDVELNQMDEASSELSAQPELAQIAQSEDVADILHPDKSIARQIDQAEADGTMDAGTVQKFRKLVDSMRDKNFEALGRKDADEIMQRLWTLAKEGKLKNFAKGEIDIGNLGYMNTAKGHEGANKILQKIMGIIREEAAPYIKDDVDIAFAKEGGDEIGIIAANMDSETLNEILAKSYDRLQSMIDEEGMRDYIHPKHNNLKTGAGYISYGAVDYEDMMTLDKETVDQFLDDDGNLTEAGMFKFADNEAYKQSKENIVDLIKKANDKSEKYVYNNKEKHAVLVGNLIEDAKAAGIVDEKTSIGEASNLILENLDKLGDYYERYGSDGEKRSVRQSDTEEQRSPEESTVAEEKEPPAPKSVKGEVKPYTAKQVKSLVDNTEYVNVSSWSPDGGVLGVQVMHENKRDRKKLLKELKGNGFETLSKNDYSEVLAIPKDARAELNKAGDYSRKPAESDWDAEDEVAGEEIQKKRTTKAAPAGPDIDAFYRSQGEFDDKIAKADREVGEARWATKVRERLLDYLGVHPNSKEWKSYMNGDKMGAEFNEKLQIFTDRLNENKKQGEAWQAPDSLLEKYSGEWHIDDVADIIRNVAVSSKKKMRERVADVEAKKTELKREKKRQAKQFERDVAQYEALVAPMEEKEIPPEQMFSKENKQAKAGTTATISTRDKVIKNAKDILPSKVADAVNVHIVGSGDQDINGIKAGLGKSNGTVFYNKKNNSYEVLISDQLAGDALVDTVYHEIVGHIGLANVLRSDKKMFKRAMKIFLADTEGREEIMSRYAPQVLQEIDRSGMKAGVDLAFSEWMAQKMADYHVNKKRDNLTQRVVRIIKSTLKRIIPGDIITEEDLMRELSLRMPKSPNKVHEGVDIIQGVLDSREAVQAYQDGTLLTETMTADDSRELGKLADLTVPEIKSAIRGLRQDTKLNPMVWKMMADKNPDFMKTALRQFDPATEKSAGDRDIAIAMANGILASEGELKNYPGARRIALQLRSLKVSEAVGRRTQGSYASIAEDMKTSPDFWTALRDADENAFNNIARYALENGGDDVREAINESFGADVYNTTIDEPSVRKQVNSDKFKEWFGDSKVVDEDGDPLVVYHGTTHDFTEFGGDTRNVEGAIGAGHYFSSSPDDASANYAGVGPDLETRIEQRKDEIYGEDWDPYDIANVLGMDENAVEDLMEDGVMTEELAEKIARKELKGGHDGAVMPAFVKMEKPFYMNEANKTPIFIEKDDAYYKEMAEEELDVNDYDTDEDYDEAVAVRADEMYWEDYNPTESGPGVDIAEAADNVLRWSEGDIGVDLYETVDRLKSAIITEEITDGQDLWSWLKENLAHSMDESGKLNSTELARQIVEQAGYDGVIQDAHKSFPGMEHVYYGDKHFIVFNSNQVKSATGNDGNFDINSPDIRRQNKPLSKAQEKTRKLMKAQRRVATLEKKLAGMEMNKKKLKEYMKQYVENVTLQGDALTSQQKDKLRAYINGLDTKTEKGLLGAKKNFAARVQKMVADNNHSAAAARVEGAFKSIPKYMEAQYQDKVDSLLEDVDFKQLSKKKAARLRQLLDLAETNNLIPADMLAETDRLGKRALKGKDEDGEYQISTAELNNIADKIEQAVHQYKLKKKLHMDRRGREYKKVEAQAKSNIVKASKTGPIGGYGAYAQDKREEKLEEQSGDVGKYDTVVGTGSMTPEVIVERIEGMDIDDENAVLSQTVYGEMDKGLTEKLRYLQEVGDEFKANFPLAVAKRISPIFHKGNQKDASKKLAEDVTLPSGVTIKMTPGQRLTVYMHSLNDHSRKALKLDGIKFRTRKAGKALPLSDADIDHIVGSVERDPEMIKMAEFMWRILNEKNTKALAAEWKNINGTEMPRVDNYFSLIREKFHEDYLMKGIDGTSMADFSNFMNTFLEGSNAFKERKDNARGAVIIEDAVEVFMRSTNLTASYVAYADRLRHAKQLLSDVKGTMKEHGREKEHIRLDRYIKDIEGTLQYQPDIFESTAKKLFGNMTRAVLGLKPGVIMRQVWSYPLLVTEIDGPHLIKAMAIAPFSKEARETRDYIMKNSPQLRARFEGGSSNAELGDRQAAEVAAQQLGKQKSFWDWTVAGISGADQFTITRAVAAAKYQIEKKQPNLKGEAKDKAVFELAEKAIRRTQPMYSNVHRSEISRSKRLLTKATFAFTSATNQINNTLRRAVMVYQRTGDKTQLAKALLAITAGMAAMVGIDELVDKLYARDTDAVTRSYRGLKYGTSPVYGASYVLGFAEAITRIMRGESDEYRGVDNFYDNLILSTLRQIWMGGEAAAMAIKDGDLMANDTRRFQYGVENFVDGLVKTFAGISPKAMKQLAMIPERHRQKGLRGEIYETAAELGYQPKGAPKTMTVNGRTFRMKGPYVKKTAELMHEYANEIFEKKKAKYETLDKEQKLKYIKAIYKSALQKAKKKALEGSKLRDEIAFEKEKK